MDVDIGQCASGSKEAWDAFVDRCSPIIVAAVRRTISGRRDVDDAVQEVFVRLIKNDYRLLKSYDPGRAALSTWLTVVARSAAIDHVRRRRLDTVPLDDRDGTPVASAHADADDGPPIPLHLLSARQRLVLGMLFDDSMTVAETARTLGVDEQTVRSTKHKALTRLREHMAPRAPAPPGIAD